LIAKPDAALREKDPHRGVGFFARFASLESRIGFRVLSGYHPFRFFQKLFQLDSLETC
jgi:hypothetical protein